MRARRISEFVDSSAIAVPLTVDTVDTVVRIIVIEGSGGFTRS